VANKNEVVTDNISAETMRNVAAKVLHSDMNSAEPNLESIARAVAMLANIEAASLLKKQVEFLEKHNMLVERVAALEAATKK
jgi:hypothetical protein